MDEFNSRIKGKRTISQLKNRMKEINQPDQEKENKLWEKKCREPQGQVKL